MHRPNRASEYRRIDSLQRSFWVDVPVDGNESGRRRAWGFYVPYFGHRPCTVVRLHTGTLNVLVEINDAGYPRRDVGIGMGLLNVRKYVKTEPQGHRCALVQGLSRMARNRLQVAGAGQKE